MFLKDRLNQEFSLIRLPQARVCKYSSNRSCGDKETRSGSRDSELDTAIQERGCSERHLLAAVCLGQQRNSH